ncbi:MAG TPA: cytochrome P450 [Streptosporangiaceae bacterium]|nr:cytochrome P450 [Streptosporangiaceae bacterium]
MRFRRRPGAGRRFPLVFCDADVLLAEGAIDAVISQMEDQHCDPLALIEEGAQLGPLFGLRLWRPAVLGYSADWNRFVLSDIKTFRSKGSMSDLSPYLNTGVVQLDAPAHRRRRQQLNRAFTHGSMHALTGQIAEVVRRCLPAGPFDAVTWSAALMREILRVTLLSGRVRPGLLANFLDPLDRALPAPFLRRPVLFHRMNEAMKDRITHAPAGTLASAFRDLPDGPEELRVAVSAGYDTTAHTLAWLLGHVAQQPALLAPERHSSVINEVLRLYPAGWVGSRRCTADVEFCGHRIGRGTLVLYSPYLTHRDPRLWTDPLTFRPERFRDGAAAWSFIPFAAGERACLGRSFAQLVLSTVLGVVAGTDLRFTAGSMRPRAGITPPGRAPAPGAEPVKTGTMMAALPRPLAASSAVVTASAVAYLGPGATALAPFRSRLFPRLSGYGDAGQVALTFDDGPDPTCTPAIPNILAEWNVHATFFMLGSMAASAPGLAREVTAAGHQVAVHGWVHRAMTADRSPVVYGDLARARDTVARISGQVPAWFRPPYGILTNGALAAARRLELQPLLWTSCGREWRRGVTPASVLTMLLRTLDGGGTVLLHDSDQQARPGCSRAARAALPALLAECSPVSWP